VDQLGEKHRTAVVLRMVYGLSVQEIAQMLGVKEKTVYTRLYDAFRKLRGQLMEKSSSKRSTIGDLLPITSEGRDGDFENEFVPSQSL
jgi:transposase